MQMTYRYMLVVAFVVQKHWTLTHLSLFQLHIAGTGRMKCQMSIY